MYLFSSNITYFREVVEVEVAHKHTNFQTYNACMKIHQISHVIFQTKSHIFFKACITLQCHETELFCTLLAENLYALDERSPSKCTFLDFRLLT